MPQESVALAGPCLKDLKLDEAGCLSKLARLVPLGPFERPQRHPQTMTDR